MKKNIKVLLILLIAVILFGAVYFLTSSKKEKVQEKPKEEMNKKVEEVEKVDIIDINSKSRPYAVTINNTPVAVKVQEGLNKAYLVYEIPTEGFTSRLLAFYKDIDESLVLGTIRSARHNFIDFALDSDAIFVSYGWSHYAEDDLKSGSTDYIQGVNGGPFYRSNPENLATEHTAYTSISKLNNHVKSKKIRNTSDDSILLNYDVNDIDLSKYANAKSANTVVINYGSPNATFKYNKEEKMYYRYENDKQCKDHKTKEKVSTKNIIIQKINYKMCDDNYYWDLKTIGNGEGFFVTNGYYVPITWSKANRNSKTVYKYKSGTTLEGVDVSGQEITVSDGRTWIEVQTNSKKASIK